MGYNFLSKNDPHRFAQTSLYQFKSKLAMAQTNIDLKEKNFFLVYKNDRYLHLTNLIHSILSKT